MTDLQPLIRLHRWRIDEKRRAVADLETYRDGLEAERARRRAELDQEIALASERVDALLFGAEDLAGDMGAVRTAASWEVFYARSAVVTAAKAYQLQAIDQVFFDLNDLAGFETECLFGRQLGYDGKMIIHPRQVEPAQRIFAPSSEEIQRAQRILAAYAEQQAAGVGAFALDGRMVDMPVVRAAEKVVTRAAEAGLLNI